MLHGLLPQRRKEGLSRYDPELLQRLEGVLNGANEDDFALIARGVIFSGSGDSPAALHNLAVFGDLLDVKELGDQVELKTFLMGLTYRAINDSEARRPPAETECFKGVADFSALPQERIEQARALVRGAVHLNGEHLQYGGNAWGSDSASGPQRRLVQTPWVAALLMERPDRAEDIIAVINAGAADAEVVRGQLDTPSQALREGLL